MAAVDRRAERLLREFNGPSASVGWATMVLLQRLTEGGKFFLKSRARAFVAAAQHKPILSSYSADGTPMRFTKRVRTALGKASFAISRGAAFDRNEV